MQLAEIIIQRIRTEGCLLTTLSKCASTILVRGIILLQVTRLERTVIIIPVRISAAFSVP